jgi:CRP/FNR family transcriptional regulator, cyclic AMP receptor protein
MGMIANAITLWLVPAVLAVLVIAAAWVGVRWYYSEYLGSLGGAPLLQRLNTRQLRSIARSAARQEFGPAGRIVTEGERGDGFYVLETGSATVTVHADPVATLGPGSYFGEMAVIDEGPRTATIVAETATTVLHLPSSALRTLVHRDPTIGDAIAAELEQRLRNVDGEIPAASGDASGIKRLEMLAAELRRVRHEDWGAEPVERRRWWRLG